MPADWSVYLLNHNGLRLDDLSKNQGFEFARVANSVGSFRVTMGQGFDDSLLAKNYRVEIWRNFLGGSVLLFSGLIDRWLTEDDNLHIEGKCVNTLLDQRVILPAAGEWGPSGVFAGTQTNDTFQLSDDNGATWTSAGTPGMTTAGVYSSILTMDNTLIAVSGSNTGGELGKIHRSTDGGRTWTLVYTATNTNRYIYDVTQSRITRTLVASVSNTTGRVVRSTDDGATWAESYNSAIADDFIKIEAAANGHFLWGRSSNPPRIYRSTDDGLTFGLVATFTGSADAWLYGLYALPNGYVVAGTGFNNAEVWQSGNNGETWVKAQRLRSISTSDIVYSFLQLPSGDLLAGTRQHGRIFLSSDFGGSWTPIADLTALATRTYDLLSLYGNTVLAATDNSGKIYQSDDGGYTWAELSDTGENSVNTLARTAL